MGEVYRARDTRLDRAVALKVLPENLAADASHHARFQREARIISSLNHPHVCALHDIGQHESRHYLVLELLEGETLAARLARGPLSQSQAVRVGAQIADALAAAHRHGLVHRDLKPANVMLTPSGVKLLDFGLAKPVSAEVVVTPLAATVGGGTPATAEGQIVGTLQYMAPEQVQGLPTDARTDIFALGAVLYEMMTGRKAFEAHTPAGLIASIMRSDPPAVSATVPGTPGSLDAVIERCLAKEPGERWQSAHDVKLQLEWLQSHATGAVASPPPATVHRRVWGASLAAAFAGGLVTATPLVVALWRSPAGPVDLVPRRLDMALPKDAALWTGAIPDVPEISPDGRWVAYGATVRGRRQLHLRSLASTESKVLLDNEDAAFPFWSPDSRALGFFAQASLKTISIGGGAARVLAPAPAPRGGSWGGGRILFALGRTSPTLPDPGGRRPVHDPGDRGAPRRAEIPPLPGTLYFRPRLLPDGRSFLISTFPANQPAAALEAAERGHQGQSLRLAALDSRESRLIPEVEGPASARARFAVGHMIWARDAQLLTRAFDPRSGQFTAPEVVIAQGVRVYSVARDGTIVFQAQSSSPFTQPTWFDRKGVREGTLADPDAYGGLSLSPDGRRASVWMGSRAGNQDVWEVDLSTGVLSRMTSDPAIDSDATWAPDGTRVAFTSARSGTLAVYVKDVASGREELLAPMAGRPLVVDGWTPDGRALVVRQPGGRNTYIVTLDADRTLRPLVANAFTMDETQVSPDGRWAAYNSDESGAWEVYVARFPTFTSRRRVSTAGGVQPKWRRDGKELFYLALDSSMMSVPIDTSAELTVQRPIKLFDSGITPDPGLTQYGVTPDGQRFLALDRSGREGETLTVLLNWLTPENLGRR